MNSIPTLIDDVRVIEPRVFADERGFFMESYSRRTFAAMGIDREFVQDNHSRSVCNVLRGLHYQLGRPQGKVVRALSGIIWDVAVDIRKSSPTFGKSVGVELSAENKRMLWIPEGFAHGFLVLSETAEVFYKATDFYSPADERIIRWNDPQLAISWPLQGEPTISKKDQDGLLLSQAELFA